MTRDEEQRMRRGTFNAALVALIERFGGEVRIEPHEVMITRQITGARGEDGSVWLKVVR